MRRLSKCVLGAALLGVLTIGVDIPAGAAVHLSDALTANTSASAVSEVANPDGSVTDTWSIAGQNVSVRGPAGMEVRVVSSMVNGKHYLGVDSRPAATPKGTRDSRAVYTWRSICNSLNADHGWARGCDLVQVIHQQASDWYLSDTQSMSAQYGCGFFCASLTDMVNYAYWSSGNNEVQWSPGNSTAVGSCQQATVGVSLFASVSEAFTVCPSQWGLYTLSNTQFGTYWHGQSQQTQANDGVDIVHSPPGACSCVSLHTGFYWN